ncbi:hypothetical protein B0H14DRAFT_2974382, partial [Mycena olivaceomarginata]
RAGGPPFPLLQPLPLVRPRLYVVALIPALGLMQLLFLAFVLAPRAQQVRYIYDWINASEIIGHVDAPHRTAPPAHSPLLLLLLKRDREAEAEVGRGAEFFQMQSLACAATARSSLLKMVVTRACCTGRQTRRRRRRRIVATFGLGGRTWYGRSGRPQSRHNPGIHPTPSLARARKCRPSRTPGNGNAYPTRC